MLDWKRKLTSRKLWVSVAGFITLLLVSLGKSQSDAQSVSALVMAGATIIGYVVGEGLVDKERAGKE